MKDTSLANLFEVTTNLMRAQFNFSNAHSQNTWIIHLVDIVTQLICEGIEPYIHAAMRTTTSRINESSQSLSHHHNRHVGLLIPHEDIVINETNKSLMKKIKTIIPNLNDEGGIHFNQIQKLKNYCQLLLTNNDWMKSDEEDVTYTRNMNCIIQSRSTVFGVDQPTALNEIEDYQGTDETIVSINSQYYLTQF